MKFPRTIYDYFLLLVMPYISKDEMKVTTYICSQLSSNNSNWGYISKSVLVDGFHPINNFGIMTTCGNGTGLSTEQVVRGIELTKDRGFLIISEIDEDPDLIKVELNQNYLKFHALEYVEKRI